MFGTALNADAGLAPYLALGAERVRVLTPAMASPKPMFGAVLNADAGLAPYLALGAERVRVQDSLLRPRGWRGEMYCDVKLRLVNGRGHDIGPGIIEILEEVEETGSVLKAARKVRISYSKALNILKKAETGSGRALVVSRSGGANGGSSILTDYAKDLIRVFRDMEESCYRTANECFARYRNILEPEA